MTTLQLGHREAQIYKLFKARAKRPLSQLRAIYAPGDELPESLDKCLTSIIFTLNAKLVVARKGHIERISPRGRGHVGVYVFKRR
jgi:hypothetical protein